MAKASAKKKPTGTTEVEGSRQTIPGSYHLYQQRIWNTLPWVDVGRLVVTWKTGNSGPTVETWYLNMDDDTTGGGATGTEPRHSYAQPGPTRPRDALRFLRTNTGLGPPIDMRYSLIACECPVPVVKQPNT